MLTGLTVFSLCIATQSAERYRSAHRVFVAKILSGDALRKNGKFRLSERMVRTAAQHRELDQLQKIWVYNVYRFRKLAVPDNRGHELGMRRVIALTSGIFCNMAWALETGPWIAVEEAAPDY